MRRRASRWLWIVPVALGLAFEPDVRAGDPGLGPPPADGELGPPLGTVPTPEGQSSLHIPYPRKVRPSAQRPFPPIGSKTPGGPTPGEPLGTPGVSGTAPGAVGMAPGAAATAPGATGMGAGAPGAAPGTPGAAPGTGTGAGAGTGTEAGAGAAPGAGEAGAAPTSAASAATAALSGETGGGLSGASGALVMFGDQGPVFGAPLNPIAPPAPGTHPGVPNPLVPPSPFRPRPTEGELASKGGTNVRYMRTYKMSENQSPLPQDRVFFFYNYFNEVNQGLNQRIGSPLANIQVMRYQLGFEKTFLNGYASFGLRDSINTLSSDSPLSRFAGTHTSMGDLNMWVKFVLFQNLKPRDGGGGLGGGGLGGGAMATTAGFLPPGQVNGGLISGGLCMNVPTGPGSFAGAPFSKSFRSTDLQPFLAYYWARGRFYFQGFEAVDVPTSPSDVTMIYNDAAIGYYVYSNPALDKLVNAIAPTFETHINVPTNHHGVFSISDLAGTPYVVDLTYGVNILFGRRTLLSTAIVTPVTGDKPFNFEVAALLNIYFGGRGRRPLASAPPITGG